jgi:N-acyl-D-amino-acid deacylase
MFDFAIKNGLIVDGCREKPFIGSVYTKGNHIAQICKDPSLPAAQSIDAHDLVVAPGFVDIHSHSDLSFLSTPTLAGKLLQGVTFELTGQCGISAIPINEQNRAETLRTVGTSMGVFFNESAFDAVDFSTYRQALTENGIAINQSMLIGHGTLRSFVIGFEMRQLTSEELSRMCRILEDLLSQGALGLSLGLIYPPGSFCETDELIALATVVAQADKLLAVHMRDEGSNVFHAFDEIVEVARRTGVRLQISHLKLMGTTQMGNADKLLQKLEEARRSGIQIHCDQYPYTASSTTLSALLPQWALDGGTEMLISRLHDPSQWAQILADGTPKLLERGGSQSVVICQTANLYQEFEGKTLAEVAVAMKCSEWEAIREILTRTNASTYCAYHCIDRGDMLKIMARDDIAVASDGTAYDLSNLPGKPHPRSIGTFPRFISIVREERLMPLEEAVYKMSALPARLIGLGDRIGKLTPGFPADITIFDFNETRDNATFEDPGRSPSGIAYVLVNGTLVLQNSVIAKSRPGKFYSR